MKMFPTALLAIMFAALITALHIEHVELQYQTEALSQDVMSEANLLKWYIKKSTKQTPRDIRTGIGLQTRTNGLTAETNQAN
jgi:hypothetical protein